MLECVANVSEGRDHGRLDVLAASCGVSLLDQHVDADHHRSVFTLAGPGPLDATAAVHGLAVAVADQVDLRVHHGVHPRLGALDVVPFVALGDAPAATAVTAAHDFGEWVAATLAIPVFFYDGADALGRSLPLTRREAFVARLPDLGPPTPHRSLGAVAVGARAPLVAVNCELDRPDLALARRVAAQVRERDGGLPGVRTLGLLLASRGVAQVSMNLTDLDRTGTETACTAVEQLATAAGAVVTRVELVGLAPAAEQARWSADFVARTGLDATCTVEARLAARS